MTQKQVNEINENINFEEGKIYWKHNRDMTSNWSSPLMDSLEEKGWSIKEVKGLVDIYDNEGNRVIWNALGRVNALKELAEIMR